MFFGGPQFGQSVEVAEKGSRALGRASNVGIDRYFVAGQIISEISDAVNWFDLALEEIAVLDIVLELFVEVRFDVVSVYGHHLGEVLVEFVVFFFGGRELSEDLVAFSAFFGGFWVHRASFGLLAGMGHFTED